MAELESRSCQDRRQKVLVLSQSIVTALAPTLFSHKFRLISAADPDASSAAALVGNSKTIVDAELFCRFPSLRIFVSLSSGMERIDFAECRQRGVAVVNAGDTFTVDVADKAVGLLIYVMRRVSASDRYVRAGLWRTKGDYQPLGFKLRGKQVGIVGMGRIGTSVAKRLEAFGCVVSYNSRTRKPSTSSYTFYSTARELAASCHAVILCCSLTDDTRRIADGEFFSALGKHGVVVNVGRGKLVDEAELVKRLVGGEIGGAGLDVFEDEPHVPEELFGLDNVVRSPHSGVYTPESFQAIGELVIANLDAFFTNELLLTPVDQ